MVLLDLAVPTQSDCGIRRAADEHAAVSKRKLSSSMVTTDNFEEHAGASRGDCAERSAYQGSDEHEPDESWQTVRSPDD
jgi:hypothetical protein